MAAEGLGVPEGGDDAEAGAAGEGVGLGCGDDEEPRGGEARERLKGRNITSNIPTLSPLT